MEKFQIGDQVKTTGLSNYNTQNQMPIESIGVITKLRKRYQGTPNAYVQYKIKFENQVHNKIHNDDNLDHLYNEYNIVKV